MHALLIEMSSLLIGKIKQWKSKFSSTNSSLKTPYNKIQSISLIDFLSNCSDNFSKKVWMVLFAYIRFFIAKIILMILANEQYEHQYCFVYFLKFFTKQNEKKTILWKVLWTGITGIRISVIAENKSTLYFRQ